MSVFHLIEKLEDIVEEMVCIDGLDRELQMVESTICELYDSLANGLMKLWIHLGRPEDLHIFEKQPWDTSHKDRCSIWRDPKNCNCGLNAVWALRSSLPPGGLHNQNADVSNVPGGGATLFPDNVSSPPSGKKSYLDDLSTPVENIPGVRNESTPTSDPNSTGAPVVESLTPVQTRHQNKEPNAYVEMFGAPVSPDNQPNPRVPIPKYLPGEQSITGDEIPEDTDPNSTNSAIVSALVHPHAPPTPSDIPFFPGTVPYLYFFNLARKTIK